MDPLTVGLAGVALGGCRWGNRCKTNKAEGARRKAENEGTHTMWSTREVWVIVAHMSESD